MKSFGIELFGFKKKDVSNYIQKISNQAKEYDRATVERCKVLENELDDVKAKLSDTNKELLEIKSSYQKYVNAYTKLCSDIGKAVEDSQNSIVG